MQNSFKYIVIGIITVLVLVFAGQLFWLKGLYNSIEDETTQAILSSVETADLRELNYRMNSLDDGQKQNKTVEVSGSIAQKPESKDSLESTIVRREIHEGDTISSKTITPYSGNASLEKFEYLLTEVKILIHQTIDSIVPINLNVLDSLIKDNFANKAIDADVYYSEIIDLNDSTVIKTSLVDSLIHLETQSFVYKYNPNQNLAYKIHTEPLTKTVLIRMSGILLTTFLIILILCFAFWYLIRTVFRQKTLEEMKDDFTNNMTHELKTPIAVAYSATDALLNFNKAEEKETREKYLLICKEQLLSLTGLVEQILSMSTGRSKTLKLKIEDIPIKPLVMNLVEQHKLKSGKNMAFEIQVPDDLIVRADRNHLHNMLSNLIDNAIKYSDENPEIEIRVYRKDRNTIVEVKDRGIGISEANQKHLFEKFYRVPHGNLYNVKGYGLGLYYVKTMMEKHGGSVSVKSAPGKGSVFTLQWNADDTDEADIR